MSEEQFTDIVKLYKECDSKYKNLSMKMSVELELRVKDVRKEVFIVIYKKLETSSASGSGVIGRSINVTKSFKQEGNQQRSLRREITFDGEVKTEENVEKVKLRAQAVHSVSVYTVNVSTEEKNKPKFTMDTDSVIRIKVRQSYPIELKTTSGPNIKWRIDLTVLKSISGGEASLIPKIKDMMFSKSFDEVIELDTPSDKYLFEVEMELIHAESLRSIDIINAGNYIMALINEDHLHSGIIKQELTFVNRLIDNPELNYVSLKRILPSVIAFTRNEYRQMFPPIGYYVTDKIDGKRSLAILRNNKCVIINDKLEEFTAPSAASVMVTILDGEWLDGVFYAFDILMLADKSLTGQVFEDRVTHLQKGSDLIGNYVKCIAKPYNKIETVEDIQKIVTTKRLDIKTDGLIFTKPGNIYKETVNYKWKDIKDNSIDFLCKRAPASVKGTFPFIEVPDHTMYFLFCGINKEMYSSMCMRICPGYNDIFGQAYDAHSRYMPIQFVSSSKPYAYIYYHPNSGPTIDGLIVEMYAKQIGKPTGTNVARYIIEGKCGRAEHSECNERGCDERKVIEGGTVPDVDSVYVDWEIRNIRHDRNIDLLSNHYFGNDYRVAELTWINYIDPFPVAELWEPSSVYFGKDKDDFYKEQIYFVTHIKNYIIQQYLVNMNVVVDFGAGKGQDLHKYRAAKVNKLIAIDNDKAAISELMRRRLTMQKQKNSGRGNHDMEIHSVIYNMHELLDAPTILVDILAEFSVKRVDGIVCNLAIHYFLDTVDRIRQYATICNMILNKGGVIVITCFFGELIHKLFMDNKIAPGSRWDQYQDDILKYSLERKYNEDTLLPAGQKIGVMMHFSKGEYYIENLINVQAVIDAFIMLNFEVVSNKRMDSHGYKSEMSELDKLYSSLYGEIILRKST